ncbi:MAG: response regulator [Bdellovibrionales bacterium]|nr:response regulator [Bdellovibrionales bacterium]
MLRSVPDNRSKRVLLIDDDQDISGALQKGFKHEGLSHLEVASDPFEAINMMTEKFYNFIILDWNLPAFNGGETLRKAGQAMAIELDLPNQWDYQRVPVVIFSSSPKEFSIPRKNKHFNYIGFVSKNQPLNQIVDLLNGFIQREVGH